jgi:ABC-type Fe3+/spermidine/putrescine transport system ATPase subunit
MLAFFPRFCCLVVACNLAFAQTPSRMNDKDLERLMRNVHEDAKRFSESFKKAVGKSAIRKTSRQKEAERLADHFVAQTEGMAKKFGDKKKADETLPVVYQSVGELDKLVKELSLQGTALSDWNKVAAELDQVSQQFSYTPPVR